MKVLVLWSGGVESTSLLKHLLSTTMDDVYAHHISMINPENRAGEEFDAVFALLPELRKIRKFTFDMSTISISGGKALPFDFEIQYPIAVAAAKLHGCERIYRAGCAEDDWNHKWKDGVLITENPKADEPGFSHRRRAKTLDFFGVKGTEIAPWLQFYAHPKAWHWNYLGELAPMTWSCRTPIDGNECGKCHTCLEKDAAMKGTSAIPEVAAAIELQQAKKPVQA